MAMDRETLDRMLSAHKAWSEIDGGQQADLRGADLAGLDLRGVWLVEADLTGAWLDGANLARSDLHGANLTRATLTEANLPEADLRGATLTAADCQGANLRGVNFREATFQETDLRGTELRGADLQGADLTTAVLDRANLDEALLEGATRPEPRPPVMDRAALDDNLEGADMDRARGMEADSRPPPSRWETITQRVGALFSRGETPAPAQEPPAPAAPAPAPQAGGDPAEGREPGPAERPLTAAEGQAAWREVLARQDEIKATIAEMADPAEREKAVRLLAMVQQDAAARQRAPDRGTAAELDR